MTLPSRQGFEQLALALAVGALAFAAVAAWRWRRGQPWPRFGISSGTLAGLAAVGLAIGYTVAPNIPTPAVPLTARFAANPTPDTPDTVAAGRELYQRSCALCHGPRGRGDGAMAATLNPKPFDLVVHVPQHAPGEIHYWITSGIANTAMPPWSDQLSDTERWQLVRYLEALAAGRGQPIER